MTFHADYENLNSGFLGGIFETRSGRDRREAEAEAIRAKAQVDAALAAYLNNPANTGSGQSHGVPTWAKAVAAAVGIGIIAVVAYKMI
ncbi:MAG TPA: hypothetical protein PKZ07_14700 [Sedimentisphaerales bacterium]|nr:hypothetical protein [Sedimentisphaerales bacterium]